MLLLRQGRSLFSNSSRQNATRELAAADIEKVITDDATGDEESPEELPEVNNNFTVIENR